MLHVSERGRVGEGEQLVEVALPLVVIAGHAVIRRVHTDRDVVLLNLGPEGVELGQGEGAETPQARHRCRADQDDLGTTLDDPVELADRLIHDRQGDDRGGEDAVVVVEGPFLEHPLVEGMHDGVGRLRVLGQALLEHAGQGGPHDGPVDALLVHELEARPRPEEGIGGAHRLPEDLSAGLAFGIAVLEEVLLSTGSGHHVEGRVGDVLGDGVLDGDLVAAVDLHQLDHVLVLGRQIAREGVRLLVHVVVGVEDRIVESVVHEFLRGFGRCSERRRLGRRRKAVRGPLPDTSKYI